MFLANDDDAKSEMATSLELKCFLFITITAEKDSEGIMGLNINSTREAVMPMYGSVAILIVDR